jgi:hypothetical protein
MIISETIIINKPTGKYFKYYKNLGYDLTKDQIEIDINHLSLGSKYKIEAKCHYCGLVKKIDYNSYNKSTNNNRSHYCCKNCGKIKHKETYLEKYGVENPFQLEEVKEKIKKTNLERYGVDSYTKTNEYREKSKETSLNNWGFENPSQSTEIKNRKKNTFIINWGVDNFTKTDEYKEKSKETNLKKYGVSSYTKTDEYRERVINNNLEKYGYEYHMMTDEWKDKIKSINFKKYGSSPFINEDFRKINYKIANNDFYLKYLSNKSSLFRCDLNKKHNFEINTDNFFSRTKQNLPLCTVCNTIGDSQSIKEKELFKYIQSIYNGEMIQLYRDGLEIDIYLPELKLGFEFNGLYWHSDKFKDKNYHLNKSNYFKEKDIRIIHIWEDDWTYKTEIVKSQIKNWLLLTERKIYARNCKVVEIKDSGIVENFLNDNHIQGSVRSSLKLGLYYKDELVSLMTFDHFEGRKRMEDGGWNLSRFCSKLDTYIIGGASKLLKYFIKNYEVSRIISYADRSWSGGDLYNSLGFIKISESNPDYKYILDGNRLHKSRFRKSRTGITESNLNIYKIWDCGKIKFYYRKI